ncbi:MAG: sodium-dependent transporter [Selenomonas sp.]|nr:sodium-dependent transporter [Selenomonas sp.]MBQ2137741.1 sodium-dependent transporter [Selenomonas sp.]
MNEKKSKDSSFSGQLGFVLAAAASAVGVGNLWRFPYFAAKDGGGIFLLTYLILLLTFGYALLSSDLAIGRRTQLSSIKAYGAMKPGWKFLGILTFMVPAIIMTYYAVIGGWITKYAVTFLTGSGAAAAQDDYFVGFITSPVESGFYAALFMLATAYVVYRGVERGIEASSRIIMPVLLVTVILISLYVLTLEVHDPSGAVRTGLQGMAIYLLPNFEGLTLGKYIQIVLDAMSQMFYSLSVAMGIMITYGSYVKKDVNLNQSVSQIAIVDTAVAVLAGMMIIPAIFAFSGMEGMAAGPKLMFVSLPKVFNSLGIVGIIIGAAFFLMAIFAALTSCISVLEAIVANCMEIFQAERKKVTLVVSTFYTVVTVVIALGYSLFYVEVGLPNGSTGQLLDIMDYISTACMMPIIAFLSAILIGWLVKPEWIISEMEADGSHMPRKGLYRVIIRYVAPVVMVILCLQAFGLIN